MTRVKNNKTNSASSHSLTFFIKTRGCNNYLYILYILRQCTPRLFTHTLQRIYKKIIYLVDMYITM